MLGKVISFTELTTYWASF